MSASSPTGDTTAAARPRFGDTIRNPWTEPDNPLHLSTFVRVVHRNGRMNAGTWWEVTDGKGRFWQLKAEDCELVRGAASAAVPATVQAREPDYDDTYAPLSYCERRGDRCHTCSKATSTVVPWHGVGQSSSDGAS